MANGKDKRGGGTHTFATLSKLTVIKVASAISSVLSTTESTFSLTEVVQHQRMMKIKMDKIEIDGKHSTLETNKIYTAKNETKCAHCASLIGSLLPAVWARKLKLFLEYTVPNCNSIKLI